MNKPFQALTNRGRALRLRRLALDALKQYSLWVTRLGLITNEFNGIFRVDTRSGQKYVLRVMLPEGGHDVDSVKAEMMWLDALSRETGLRVPRPLASKTGDLVIEASCEGIPEPRLCTVFGWVPGTNLAEHMNAANVFKLGRLAAQLHAHAAGFRRDLNILRYDKVFPFPEPVILFDDAYRHLFPPRRRAAYAQAVERAQSALDRLRASGEPARVIHNDLHQWNVRVFRGVLAPIDFEDLMYGWPVQDIATTLHDSIDRKDYIEVRAAFRQGYASHSPWPERYLGEIDAFIAARAVGLANFILQDPNPDWKAKTLAYVQTVEKRLRRLEKSRV